MVIASYFIWYAAENWEKTPTVTTVDFKKIENETFPAISLCFDTTWKWPGLINFAVNWNKNSTSQYFLQKMNENTDHSIQMETLIGISANLVYSNMVQFESRVNGTTKLDICQHLNYLFIYPEEKEVKDFFLTMAYQIEKMDSLQAFSLMETFYITFEETAHPQIFEVWKQWICSAKLLNCGQNQENHCTTGTLLDYFYSEGFEYLVGYDWAISRYFNEKSYLTYLTFLGFKYPDILKQQEILEGMQNIASKDKIDLFSLWHYINGLYIEPEGFGDTKIQLWEHYPKNGSICIDAEHCKVVQDWIEELGEDNFQRIIELIDQPKAHLTNSPRDFVLVPLCSFGTGTLQKCNLFKKAPRTYQDHTCYTFDEGLNVQPYVQNGLHLLLNLKHLMPSEQRLALKLFVHEHGSVPDVLGIDSTFEKIQGHSLTKVGIGLTSNRITDNFAAMSFEKRKCLLEGERKDYSRTRCVVEHIHELAREECGCEPILMTGKINDQSRPQCNVNGSYCFRNAVEQARLQIDSNICPPMCESRQFTPLVALDEWDDPFSNGNELRKFVGQNPFGMYLEYFDLEYDEFDDYLYYPTYVKAATESYSLVQIYFNNPLKTVITKDAKFTVPDMVSNIGGTVGIFLGLSTISLLTITIKWLKVLKTKYPFLIRKCKQICSCCNEKTSSPPSKTEPSQIRAAPSMVSLQGSTQGSVQGLAVAYLNRLQARPDSSPNSTLDEPRPESSFTITLNHTPENNSDD